MFKHFAKFVLSSFLFATFGAIAEHNIPIQNIQLGPRPFFLVSQMNDSPLKRKLQSCTNGPFKKSNFSIGHRGAAMMFPEHTVESYEAAARMGAGVIECDVTFTKDKELVCRHAQNDLHTTTNILLTPLAAKCTKPFTPFDLSTNSPATAECRASDITLAEFKSLRGKMDGFNPKALTAQEFMAGTPAWRTDLYSGPTSGTLMSHKESIALFKRLGVKMTPELKEASVTMPFEGFTQQQYAQKMIDEYKQAGVKPSQVFAQSFNEQDIVYWIEHEPSFAKQAVFLDAAETVKDLPSLEKLKDYKRKGVKIVAPPVFALLTLEDGKLVPSDYAKNIKKAELDIITWSLERSGVMALDKGGWYYQSVTAGIQHEGDILEALHVLNKDIGIRGIFSDWPATVTFYANCMGLK
jgi:glycerophosphoryl diester phosphodiesterase